MEQIDRMTKKETCPFCGKETERKMRLQGSVVIYECENCSQITAAYSKDLHTRLKDFGDWYETNTFKAQPPRWIVRRQNEGN